MHLLQLRDAPCSDYHARREIGSPRRYLCFKLLDGGTTHHESNAAC